LPRTPSHSPDKPLNLRPDVLVEKRHDNFDEAAEARTKHLVELLQSNTALTQQDKDLTEQVAKLTREIHALLTQRQAAG
jgi:hypothetical protein